DTDTGTGTGHGTSKFLGHGHGKKKSIYILKYREFEEHYNHHLNFDQLNATKSEMTNINILYFKIKHVLQTTKFQITNPKLK
ncbi:hypothetical protein KSS87_008269, partial [Heliosperma pusillum]